MYSTPLIVLVKSGTWFETSYFFPRILLVSYPPSSLGEPSPLYSVASYANSSPVSISTKVMIAAPVSNGLFPPAPTSTFQPFATLVVTFSSPPLRGVPPDTVRVAAVLSVLPTTLPSFRRPTSSYISLEYSSENVRFVITFSTPSLSRAIETIESSWIAPSITSISNSVGDFTVAFTVKFVSRPSLRIQTLFALA